jgi:hypothetical protein
MAAVQKVGMRGGAIMRAPNPPPGTMSKTASVIALTKNIVGAGGRGAFGGGGVGREGCCLLLRLKHTPTTLPAWAAHTSASTPTHPR